MPLHGELRSEIRDLHSQLVAERYRLAEERRKSAAERQRLAEMQQRERAAVPMER